MESIKARINGQGIERSVEFSLEEAMSQPRAGKAWRDMDAGEREQALKDYALSLFARQEGMAGGDMDVRLEGGTLSGVPEKDI